MPIAEVISAALAQCAAALDAGRGALASLLLAGLLSGMTHCAGMCGPFVLAQVGPRLAAVPAARLTSMWRLSGAAALPYQLGRMTTYAALGAAVGAAGGLLPLVSPAVAAAALSLVAAMFLLHGLGRLQPAGVPWAGALSGLAARLLDRPFGWRGYAVGLGLGLLPCGVVYAALAVAATTGSATTGGLAMLLFALGTVPGLAAVGWAGHAAMRRWQRPLRHLPAALLLLNAAMLLLLASRLLG